MGIKDRLKSFRVSGFPGFRVAASAGTASGGSTKKPDRRIIGVPKASQRWDASITGALTPARLARIIRSANSGSNRELLDLMDDIEEKDTHIQSCMQTRRLAILGCSHEIIPASEDEHDVEIAEFVKTVFDSITDFRDGIEELLDAIAKGYAVCELVWEMYDNRFWVDSLVPQPQRRFILDDYENLKLWDGGGGTNEFGDEIPENKLVIHRYRRHGSIIRSGVMRTVIWLHMFKNYSIKDWIGFLEIYGQPLRVGTYQSGATAEDIQTLTKAVIEIATDAGAIISEATKIEFIEALRGSSSDSYDRFVAYCDREISKVILGQTLTSDVGAGGTGSFALGKVHSDVRQDYLEADGEKLDETINQQMIVPLVDYNFGEQNNYPKYHINTLPPEDQQQKATTVETLGRAGLRIPSKWAHKEFNIPEPKEGEPVLSPQSNAPPSSPFGFSSIENPETRKPGNPETVTGGFSTAAKIADPKMPPVGRNIAKDVQARMEKAYEKRRKTLIAAAKAGELSDRPRDENMEISEIIRAVLIASDMAGRDKAKDEG